MHRRMIPDIENQDKTEINEVVDKSVDEQGFFFGNWIFWLFIILIFFFIFGNGFFWRY